MIKYHIYWILILGAACQGAVSGNSETELVIEDRGARNESFWPTVDGFDFPVGPPDARGYYNAQAFGMNFHLGDDWNGVGGGNTDMGDSVFSIAHGVVLEANDFGGGWGNVVRIGHKMRPSDSAIYMESLYAHLLNFGITTGDTLRRGDFIGRIGNANGAYLAHLHLEIRDTLGLPLGGGYSQHTRGYLAPTIFIKNNRP